MYIAPSILGIKENLFENIEKMNQTNCDFIHLDIMDGKFVSNKNEYEIGLKFKKPLDIHLMVEDIENYIEKYKKFNPDYLTFHLEATNEIDKMIKLIKHENIKVGISIKPSTKVLDIEPYLKNIDLVLIMSVEPGLGGQKFLENTVEKINQLKKIKQENNYSYLIEIDGGINDNTIQSIKKADIVVVGSYITNSDNYQKQINILKGK